jgi:omega-hydroxy-beta-dihydromenaquinone-9 sulfotransferase
MTNAKKKRPYKETKHQLYLGSRKVWNQLRKENKIEGVYKKKARNISLLTFILQPLLWLQRFLYNKKVEQQDIFTKSPLFVLGHWRSGTTHLHYIFHRDPQFGTLSNYQNFTFNVSLLSPKLVKWVLSPLMPETRPQDNVKVDADKPAEEEQPLSMMSTRTGIHSWYFPNNPVYFDKYNLFKNITPEEKKAWQDDYIFCVKSISFFNNGKQLVLKNPHNTGRVKELLELFPQSKFVFIHRNPFDIFLSTRHLYYRMLRTQFLQFKSHQEIDDKIFYYFNATMQKYLDERHLIPKENLIEIGFDELEEKPYEVVERIYSELNIPHYEIALPEIDKYLKSVKNYEKNKFRDIKPEVEQRILREWKFAFDEWNYSYEK